MAGYSYGRADIVRRAMSKKKHDVMLKERDSFVEGSVANGVDEKIANEIFDEMIAFASYAFPKGHAAAYATIAYQTAYLKYHHPREYMAALLTSILENSDKVIDYIAEAKKLGIAVLPPDVRESDMGFTVVDGGIRFGLLAVKNLGRGFIAEIIKERAEKPFRDFLDFLERMYGKDLNKRGVESLIKCGAMDSFGHRRSQMLEGYESLLDSIESTHRGNVEGQLDLFGSAGAQMASTYLLPDIEESPLMKLLAEEKETTGLYLSGHPLEQHDDLVAKLNPYTINKVHKSENLDGQTVQVVGIVSSKRLRTTKNNDMMAFIFIEDKTASIELIVFPRAFTDYGSLLNVGQVVAVRGKVKSTEEESAQIVVDQILTLEEAAQSGFRDNGFSRPMRDRPLMENYQAAPPESPATQEPEAYQTAPAAPPQSGKQGLFLRFPDKDSELVEKASNVLFVFEGGLPVYFYYLDTGKYVRTPRSYWIAPNDVMIGELRRLLGRENVSIRE
jgi:DNA polymerase-3 subunit alpha